MSLADSGTDLGSDFRPAACFADSKLINRALFGAYYEEDIYDKACAALPWAARALWWRVPKLVRERKLIFVAPILVRADKLNDEAPRPKAYTLTTGSVRT